MSHFQFFHFLNVNQTKNYKRPSWLTKDDCLWSRNITGHYGWLHAPNVKFSMPNYLWIIVLIKNFGLFRPKHNRTIWPTSMWGFYCAKNSPLIRNGLTRRWQIELRPEKMFLLRHKTSGFYGNKEKCLTLHQNAYPEW